jgi:fluoroacetyl-CoA thioesterase
LIDIIDDNRMGTELLPGLANKREITVTPDKTATAFGSGNAEVFATPAMIALMEQTAMDSVSSLIPSTSITVGTAVTIQHVRATGVGARVSCRTVLASVEGRKLTFSVEAFDESGLIGKGTHVRYVVDKEVFMNSL